MSSHEVTESLSYLRDLERIEGQIFDSAGDLASAQRRIDQIRDAARKLAEFPGPGPDRFDLRAGTRMLTRGEKSV